MRRKQLLFGLLLSLCLAANAFAESAAIGFVDLQKAVAGTQEWKKQFASFKAEFQKEQTNIAAREKQMKTALDELTKQGFVLDPNLKKDKEEKFRNDKRDFERYVQDKNDEFNRREREITEGMLKKMFKVVHKLGEDKKLAMIVDEKNIVYHAPELDLTELAIKTYDKTYGEGGGLPASPSNSSGAAAGPSKR